VLDIEGGNVTGPLTMSGLAAFRLCGRDDHRPAHDQPQAEPAGAV
jgi:hypothetical protein